MQASLDGRAVAIVGGSIIDGTGAPPVPDGTVVVEGGRIAAAGPRDQVRMPAGSEVWDARGQTVLPGLIDMHIHSIHPSNHTRYVNGGVTSVRFAGGQQAVIAGLRDRIERAELPGPRILSCGPLVDQAPAAYPHNSLELRDADHATAAIGRLIDNDGVDAIIVTQRIGPEVLTAVLDAAHARGIPVTGQTWVTTGREAAELGIDGLENTSRIPEDPLITTDVVVQARPVPERLALLARLWNAAPEPVLHEVLRVMADHQVTWTPTLVVFEYFARSAELDREVESTLRAADDDEAATWRQLREVFAGGWGPREIQDTLDAIARIKEAVAYYHELGGPVATGSDLTFGAPMLHRELRLLHDAGLMPLEVIRSATAVPARALRREAEFGTLAAGRQADLLLVPGDPLVDLRVLEQPSVVLIGGRWVAGANHAASRPKQKLSE